MATEFQQYRDEYNRLRNSISPKIDTLDSLSADKQGQACTEIDNGIREMRSILDQTRQGRVMWEGSEVEESKRFITQSEAEIQRLQTRFSEQRDRGNLFSRPAGALEGGSRSQRDELLAQRQGIEKSGEYVQSIRQMAHDTERSGHGILEELGNQKTTEIGLSGKMDDLSDGVAVGAKALSRIEARERMKTIIIWIVVGLAIVGLGVFLYFVFRPE
jgi:hypothetical protein